MRQRYLPRIAKGDQQLRSDFAELEFLEYRPSYDECLKIVKRVFTLK